MKYPASLAACAVAFTAVPCSAFELDGTWNIASMCTPAVLEPVTGENGVLTDLRNTDQFDLFSGQVTVTGNTFSGTFDGPWSGTISVNSSGGVTIVDDEAESIPYIINSSSDFMAGLEPAPGQFQEIELWVKQPTTTTLADVAGTWNLVAMGTPSELLKTFDMGFLTGMTRGDHFEIVKGPLTITGGDFSVTLPGEGTSGGTIEVTSPGVLRVTSTDPDPDPPFDLFLNASKDVMIGAVAESDFHELLILLKAPTTGAQHDLQGRWPFVSYNTPAEVSLVHTGMGEVTGVTNAMNFEAGVGFLQIQADGSAFGRFEPDESFTGSVTLTTTPGQATMTFIGDPPFTACTNANLDVFAAPNADGTFNELLVGVRSIKPFGLEAAAIPESDGIEIRWVGAPNRRLQQLTSTGPVTWTDVDGALGQSSIALPLGSGPVLFRVAED